MWRKVQAVFSTPLRIWTLLLPLVQSTQGQLTMSCRYVGVFNSLIVFVFCSVSHSDLPTRCRSSYRQLFHHRCYRSPQPSQRLLSLEEDNSVKHQTAASQLWLFPHDLSLGRSFNIKQVRLKLRTQMNSVITTKQTDWQRLPNECLLQTDSSNLLWNSCCH